MDNQLKNLYDQRERLWKIQLTSSSTNEIELIGKQLTKLDNQIADFLRKEKSYNRKRKRK